MVNIVDAGPALLVSVNLSLESADLLKVGRVVRILVHQDLQGEIVGKVNK